MNIFADKLRYILDQARDAQSWRMGNKWHSLKEVWRSFRGDKQYKYMSRILKVFLKKTKVPNSFLAQCIKPTVFDHHEEKYKKSGKKEYKFSKKIFDRQIKNRFISLNKLFKPHGFRFSHGEKFSTMEEIKTTDLQK